ncbi:pectate lyase family protein [Pararcticibacter amylolyticus]|uniref:Pectate lyase n=1 Tax=Pararcticibacter amylolyticus TaxID=2173175 RepID=A0A2U2PC61_9SPHI|nr:hypothetical protein [Pararcticibacter amylolyticus]PWG78991.1 hypothetical protein DDR33_19270 [Pararcticibacter amylolyticus]
MIIRFFSFCILIFACCCSFAQQRAFPGAEGFGKAASGGRGGTVYHVTNLNDSGPGSFREAVSEPGRTVVFDVGGVIKLNSRIQTASDLTIAGQTAPGEGIVVYGHGISFSGQKNVIVRYMRFRGSINMARGSCTLTADNAENMIFDHVSVQWGRWDNLHIKNSKNITLQYCIVGEAIDPQRFGALLERPERLTIYHCLWIDNQSRNPKAKADIEFVNNVIYNWGSSGFVGGHSSAHHHQDLIGNYFIAGPSSKGNFVSMFDTTDHVYHKANMVDADKDGSLSGRLVTDEDFTRQKATLEAARQNVSIPEAVITGAEEALGRILKEAGASVKRDAVDQRLIGYLKSYGKEGQIFRTEQEAGGQGQIAGGKPEKDTDGDGMPDRWEKKHKLNRRKADGAVYNSNGYTNLEAYLNSIGM